MKSEYPAAFGAEKAVLVPGKRAPTIEFLTQLGENRSILGYSRMSAEYIKRFKGSDGTGIYLKSHPDLNTKKFSFLTASLEGKILIAQDSKKSFLVLTGRKAEIDRNGGLG
jgi:hypothetical protein